MKYIFVSIAVLILGVVFILEAFVERLLAVLIIILIVLWHFQWRKALIKKQWEKFQLSEDKDPLLFKEEYTKAYSYLTGLYKKI